MLCSPDILRAAVVRVSPIWGTVAQVLSPLGFLPLN